MSDQIERQAAISAICNACGKIDCDKMDKCEKLQLPPANCSEFPNNSDTISRQAAIDGLMCLVKQNECDLMPDLLHWTGVKAMLESLPSAQPEPKWIPCSERLPEEGVNVLLCIKDWESQKTKIVVSLRRDYNYWDGLGRDIRGDIAWMPLPEALKGEHDG